ncbi:Acetyl-coenzyme A carboxylase carboxyl transferase subunits beta/alpha [Desulfovibrionales bacterium]
MDTEKRLQILNERLRYIQDILGPRKNGNIRLLASKLAELMQLKKELDHTELVASITSLEDLFVFLENKLERELTPMDKVRIVRHPQRICLKDILEHVYDNYTEIGGQDEYSIDPSMLIARAYITRRRGRKVIHQPVMVIGQEKGHGQEFRNGGSVKPWGNANALHYMRVAETENIPIHTYIFTPGAFPVEDYPGAAQQIARNLYEMAGLSVPIVTVFSEGGSGGAEAIGLADYRLMLSHGYYSVISPEGGAAIEAKTHLGQCVPPELIDRCAQSLKITAEDNLRMGYIDRIVQEPPLGARPEHYEFFRNLRHEVIRATDHIVLGVRGIKLFLFMVIRGLRDQNSKTVDPDKIYVRWSLSTAARERLLVNRYQKFSRLSRSAYIDCRPQSKKLKLWAYDIAWSVYSFLKYDFWKKHHKRVGHVVEDLGSEAQVALNAIVSPFRKISNIFTFATHNQQDMEQQLTQLSCWEENDQVGNWHYVSPKAREDRAITCPNAVTHGCLDLWAPDLYGDFAGVCSFCGHHFSMEYLWYLYNVFDPGSIYEFNAELESANPLEYEGLDLKLKHTKKETGLKSACMTFEARISNIKIAVAMLVAAFRGGSVGAAEGEKFFRATERAHHKRLPLLAYVHGTAGIRIQEGVNGVIQMPRCTMAIRRYIDAGGLYLVLYDTNSYAGPVASFLGCSPYQFSVRSANIGFAGPGVIKETTGIDIPPDYHRAYRAISRGHIQGIWDRREIRTNLYQALLTMGGRNIYYR